MIGPYPLELNKCEDAPIITGTFHAERAYARFQISVAEAEQSVVGLHGAAAMHYARWLPELAAKNGYWQEW